MKRLLMLISVALCCASTVAQKPIEVTDTEVEQHGISSQRFLPIKQDNSWRPYVKLEITVGPDGRVMSAEPQEGDAHYYAAAVHAALDWTYKPFARNGHAISVNFSEYVRVVPPERRPTQHVTFPEIKDWNSLRITLERTGCFGSCPTYALELRGNGAVQYVGGEFVKYCGEWRGEVPVSSVRGLVAQFRGTDYFSLFPKYAARVTDNPTFKTSIAFDDKKMSVTDYVGPDVGMPLSVLDLEDAIDHLAGPEHWSTRQKVPPEVDNCGLSEVPAQNVSLPDTIPAAGVKKP